MTETHKRVLGLAVASMVFGCFFIIPLLGGVCSLVALFTGIVAYVRISRDPKRLSGEGFAVAGIVLGAVGIVASAILALLMAISIPGLLRARSVANEKSAADHIKVLSQALEVYALEHEGRFPADEEELMSPGSAYEGRACDGQTFFGYAYSLTLDPEGYTVTAAPVTCGSTGDRVYSASTGSVFREEACVSGSPDG